MLFPTLCSALIQKIQPMTTFPRLRTGLHLGGHKCHISDLQCRSFCRNECRLRIGCFRASSSPRFVLRVGVPELWQHGYRNVGTLVLYWEMMLLGSKNLEDELLCLGRLRDTQRKQQQRESICVSFQAPFSKFGLGPSR